jgi:thiamine-phosphate pyrophosphorylase
MVAGYRFFSDDQFHFINNGVNEALGAITFSMRFQRHYLGQFTAPATDGIANKLFVTFRTMFNSADYFSCHIVYKLSSAKNNKKVVTLFINFFTVDLIIITPDNTWEDEIEIVNKMLANGLQRLHIRKPMFTADDYRNYIKSVRRKYHSYIVIHGCFELYRELRLGGIHLNTAARNDTLIWDQVKDIPSSAISASFHSWQEVLENEFHYRYVFISPVFDSISKPGYKSAIDLNGAVEIKQKLLSAHRYCPQIVGLGGVGPQQLHILREHGFDGGAMLGSIWDSAFPFVMFLEAMVQLKSSSDG